jgi:hypothetical protein
MAGGGVSRSRRLGRVAQLAQLSTSASVLQLTLDFFFLFLLRPAGYRDLPRYATLAPLRPYPLHRLPFLRLYLDIMRSTFEQAKSSEPDTLNRYISPTRNDFETMSISPCCCCWLLDTMRCSFLGVRALWVWGDVSFHDTLAVGSYVRKYGFMWKQLFVLSMWIQYN